LEYLKYGTSARGLESNWYEIVKTFVNWSDETLPSRYFSNRTEIRDDVSDWPYNSLFLPMEPSPSKPDWIYYPYNPETERAGNYWFRSRPKPNSWDYDTFSVFLTEGVAYEFRVNNLSPEDMVFWVGEHDDDLALASSDCTDNYLSACGSFTPSYSGLYYWKVGTWFNRYTPYSIQYRVLNGADDVPNIGPGAVPLPLSYTFSSVNGIAGELETSSDVDLYQFTVRETIYSTDSNDDKVGIEICAETAGGVVPYFRIYEADYISGEFQVGSLLQPSGYSATYCNGNGGRRTYFPMAGSVAPGQYFLKVYNYSTGASYRLKGFQSSGKRDFVAAVDLDGANPFRFSTPELTGTTSEHIRIPGDFHELSDVDDYLFDLEEGQRVLVAAHAHPLSTKNAWPELFVRPEHSDSSLVWQEVQIPPTDNELIFDMEGGVQSNGRGAMLSFTAPHDGTYRVRVRPQDYLFSAGAPYEIVLIKQHAHWDVPEKNFRP
jgi:hypothetical protein